MTLETHRSANTRRGKLKIFLGYAAGVGKTYAMLNAALQRKEEGVDVVIGLIETHQSVETGSLAAGLERLPLQAIDYRGEPLTELDVEAALDRHPALVLVDDLAHSNAPGARHIRRYQDIQELLEAGMDVYTTLNIQHLESLNDVVAQITGAQVRETVPDRVIDEASELELIDLPPDELLSRLQQGRVFVPQKAARTLEKFFRKGNLTALRQMTLRRVAERVDDQMRAYMRASAIPGPWAAAERLLVCLSPNRPGERLIRSAQRLANKFNAEWFAIYIETPSHSVLSPSKHDQINRALQLAEELGARTKIIPASNSTREIAGAILEYAHAHNVTKILLGKPTRPDWFENLRGSLETELSQRSGEIDLYIITDSESAAPAPEKKPLQPHYPLSRYLWGILLTLVTTALGFAIELDISPTNLVMLYLLAVVIAAVYLGRGPAILVSILGVAAFDFFFVPPTMTLSIADTEYLITFIGLFLVGTVISALAVRAREQAEAAQRREADTAVLYALSRDLAAADSLEAVIQAIRMHIIPDFGREVSIYLAEGDALHLYKTDALQPPVSQQTELDTARWVSQHGKPAGRGTDTLPAAEASYMPLKTSLRTMGVLSVKPQEPETPLTADQRRLLEAFSNQAAQALERVQLAEQARQMKLLQAAEKLQNALLNSISHDLRTPLVSITGALTTLEQQSDLLDPESRQSLIETAREEADRLNRLVGNLLDMTRLEAGALKVKREPSDLQDVIGASIGQMEERLAGRSLSIKIPDPFPLVALDFVLIVHVLNNLLDNALKYSPPGSALELRAEIINNEAQLSVIDQGMGIPADDLERVFDKFYRVQRSQMITGTGLGLAICKGLIEAHDGRIWAANREGGGTIVTIALPVYEQ